MKNIVESVYILYLQDNYEEIAKPFVTGEKNEEYDKVWDDLNENLPFKTRFDNDELRNIANSERDEKTFKDAFKLGLMLGMEVFGNE